MPQPSTRRSALDAFLPQFAAADEDHLSAEATPDGGVSPVDALHPDAGQAVNGMNGHATSFESPNGLVDNSAGVLPPYQNGHREISRLERALNHAPLMINGAATVFEFEDPFAEALHPIGRDVVATTDHPREPEASIAGDVPVEEPQLPELPVAESVRDLESPPESEQIPSPPIASAVPEHPAAGSTFTPYLVTEIRELRNRSAKRSWWRRLFG